MGLNLGGCDGACVGVKLRDETIKQLRAQIEDMTKTQLAILDAKAYAIRYPAERAAQRPAAGSVDRVRTSPGEFRNQRFQPTQSSEEIEATFASQRDAINAEQERVP